MSQDARLAVTLPSHPKTKKLIRRLGAGGAWHLVCLFLWAASNRADGDLSGLTAEDVELAVDWQGEEGAFVNALLQVGFLDGQEGSFAIHDWQEHNPWAAGADLRSAKARWNAVKRHHGEREADRQVPEWASHRSDSKGDAASNAISKPVARDQHATRNAPSPSPYPSPSKSEGEPASRNPGTPEDSQLPEGVDPERWAAYRDQLADDGKLSISRIKTALMQLRRVTSVGHDANAVLTAAVMRGLRDLDDCAARLARERQAQPPSRAGPTGQRQPAQSRTVQAIQALNEVTDRVASHPENSPRLADARASRRPPEASLPEP